MAAPSAAPRRISINGAVLHPVIESKWLPSGREGLPVWFLPRLGLETRNDPQNLWLSYQGRTLRFTAGRWSGDVAGAERLSPPEPYGAARSLHVPLDVLRLLGVPMAGSSTTLNVEVRRAARPVPIATTPLLAAPAKANSTQAAPKMVSIAKPAASVTVSSMVSSAPVPSQPVAAPVKPVPVRVAPPVATVQIVSVAPTPAVPVTASPVASKPASKPPFGVSMATPISSIVPVVPRPMPLVAAETPPAPSAPPSQQKQLSEQKQPSPDVPLIGPRVLEVRSSLTPIRNILAQRIVIDLTGPVEYSVQRSGGQVSVFLLGASAQPSTQKMDSGDTLSFAPAVNAQGRPGIAVRLQTAGAVVDIQTLQNPDRLVIDSATSQTDSVPPPVNEATLPQGVTLRTLGGLSLLSFDPARFVPRVVAAPTGSALSVAELVRRVGGVAGVNGGYFDPPSSLSVDFVTVAGQMLSSSLEKRAAVGFDAAGRVQFGYPRPRYVLEGNFGTLLVNTVSGRVQPSRINAFVGDGRTAVGASGLLTLLLPSTGTVTVSRAAYGVVVPPVGTLALSFDPNRYPQLPRSAGDKLTMRLDYQLNSWDNVREGLAAGPLLLSGGKVVLDPAREAFNVYGSIWRPTRQVAFALYQGQPTIAFLENGTPENFAAALARAGVSDALRLDSGSSATVYTTGGYLGTGGYLNTVWSRPVPNAIVLVPVR